MDFVCYRGTLSLLFCSPYEDKDDWLLGATKYKGTIYIAQFPTERRVKDVQNRKYFQKKMCSWGFKFEQYLTTGMCFQGLIGI